MKPTDSVLGKVMNVVSIDGMKYKDWVKLFPKPQEISRWNEKSWNFEFINGTKFSIRFSVSDYQNNKLRKYNLKKTPGIDIEKIDFMTIQGRFELIILLKMAFILEYNIPENEVNKIKNIDKIRAFEYLFRKEKWQ